MRVLISIKNLGASILATRGPYEARTAVWLSLAKLGLTCRPPTLEAVRKTASLDGWSTDAMTALILGCMPPGTTVNLFHAAQWWEVIQPENSAFTITRLEAETEARAEARLKVRRQIAAKRRAAS